MKIYFNASVNFERRLKPQEEVEFSDVLKRGKEKVGNRGKSILIIPSVCLPQSPSNNTGVGNLGSEDSLKFFDFAKKYWGINEVQILPVGQFHKGTNGTYPMYSGTSMDLGNHMVNAKAHMSQEVFDEVVRANTILNEVNYGNVININSPQDKALWKLYHNMTPDVKQNFELYKQQNSELIEPKALYRALCEINGTYKYEEWNDTDKNLYELDEKTRKARIKQIYEKKGEVIDFYKFNQYLAETDLKSAKEKLNAKGLKLNGDMIIGFSYNEVWSHPKAFHKGKEIYWGLPALNYDSPEGEKLLREKVALYAKRFDGFRIDASWIYSKQPGTNIDYKDRILNIIDEEVRKVKGANYDLKNIMHELAAESEDFNIFDRFELKPFVRDRVKIYTSDWLSNDWGSNHAFLERKWAKDSFIVGATNHDSKAIKYNEEQAQILSKILKIPQEKLKNPKEFIKAKLAEPMSAFNNMIYFREIFALEKFDSKVPHNYEEVYFKLLEKGEGFNPMDALEKLFKAKDLVKEEPELYAKIVKYKEILETAENNDSKIFKIGLTILGLSILTLGFLKYTTKSSKPSSQQ